MANKTTESGEQYTAKEIEQRLRATLGAAFGMSPTPLKAIPKRNGESRGSSRKRADSSAASAKNGRPKP
jgi:hypothetical protein